MVWQIKFDPKAQKELESVDRNIQKRIINFLKDRVAASDNPRSFGEALRGPDLGKFWKYRVGDYRIVCQIQDQLVSILVLRMGHRREIYKQH